MCGIIGAYAPHGTVEVRAILNGMGRLVHRGPDGSGLFLEQMHPGSRRLHLRPEEQDVFELTGGVIVALGHRRLAIIDLAGGAQPLANEDNSVWITYNGEVYNYVELQSQLKQRGHHFRTSSDTEVIVHAYEEWGESCVTRFNGIFAFAIWDARRPRLFLARDHMGVKPMYCTWCGDAFLFASEIKALLTYPGVVICPHPPAIASYFRQGYVNGDETFFAGIYKLPPAHWLTVDAEGRVQSQCFWQLPATICQMSLVEAAERLGELLCDAVRLQLRSDVEVGAHLSGGIDSSLVVAHASQQLAQPLQTFTGCWIPDTPQDERRYARLVASRYGTRHHEIVLAEEAPDHVDTLRRMVWYLDEPVAGPGVIPQYWVSRLCSQHVKVVLGGQGGDELFGGYLEFLPALLHSCIQDVGRAPGLDSFAMLIQTLASFAGLLSLEEMSRAFKRRLHGRRLQWLAPGYNVAQLPDQSRDTPSDNLTPVDRSMRQAVTGYLGSLLQIEDRTSMAVSLESRVPLLDYRIVEFAVQLPYILKFRGKETKSVVRWYARTLLPPEILERTDKVGFSPPSQFWYGDSMRELVCQALDPNSVCAQSIIEPKALAAVRHAYAIRDNSYLLYLWRIVNLDLWFRIF